jgi:hypothetical protein
MQFSKNVSFLDSVGMSGILVLRTGLDWILECLSFSTGVLTFRRDPSLHLHTTHKKTVKAPRPIDMPLSKMKTDLFSITLHFKHASTSALVFLRRQAKHSNHKKR